MAEKTEELELQIKAQEFDRIVSELVAYAERKQEGVNALMAESRLYCDGKERYAWKTREWNKLESALHDFYTEYAMLREWWQQYGAGIADLVSKQSEQLMRNYFVLLLCDVGFGRMSKAKQHMQSLFELKSNAEQQLGKDKPAFYDAFDVLASGLEHYVSRLFREQQKLYNIQ